MSRTSISVDHIARVEGHGDIHLVIEDGAVATCEFSVVEPARLFESMVRGRYFEEVPYIASRVCGICSSSHVITDLRAVEQIFGVEVSDRTRALRELLVYGSYLQNHATHLFVFAAPDFLGHKSVFPLADAAPELFEDALGLKALGNELCTKIGGRSIHPIAVVGGFTHEISRDEYLALADKLEGAIDFACSCVDLFNDFNVVDIETEGDMLAMVAPGAYPVIDSDTARFVRAGYEFDCAQVDDEIEEYAVGHSAAFFARARRTGKPYMTAALARINASWDHLSKRARRESRAAAACVQPVREQHRAGRRDRRRARPLRGPLPPPCRRRVRGIERAGFVRGARGARRGLHRSAARRALPRARARRGGPREARLHHDAHCAKRRQPRSRHAPARRAPCEGGRERGCGAPRGGETRARLRSLPVLQRALAKQPIARRSRRAAGSCCGCGFPGAGRGLC